jgi:5-methylcytosine-specific restriction endonuclease McrA
MYECPRCAYVCINMGDLRKHLSKNKKCEPTKLNIATEDIIVENCKKKEENVKCEYCNNLYSSQKTLDVHTETCLKKKTPEELRNIIKQLKKTNKEQEKTNKEQEKTIEEKEEIIKEKEKIIKESNGIVAINNDNDNNDNDVLNNNLQQLLDLMTQKFVYVDSILTANQKTAIEDKIESENKIKEYIKLTTIKKNIPKTVRDKLWYDNFNDNPNGKCYVCNRIVMYSNFHAGHVISSKHGGNNNINNLRVTCQLCNTSMGSQNLEEFKTMYFS